MKINATEIRVGMILEHKDDLWEVLKTQHVKPGKGGAFAQVEMKSLNKNTKLNERFRSSETVEKASLEEIKFNYLYDDEADYFFMKSKIFAQNNLKKDELLLFNKLFDIMLASLPVPDLLVYLHSDIKRLQENIHSRGREFELNIQNSYLKSIEESYFDYLKKQEITSVLLIDVTNVDFVKNENNYRKICKLISENYTKGETKNIIL